jgi:hypothetical protein
MIYGEQYIIDRVRAGNYGRIDIFEGHINTHQGASIFMTIREDSPEHAVLRMQEFCTTSTGSFTVYLRKRHNTAFNMSEVVKIDLVHSLQKFVPGEISPANNEAIINSRIDAILKERERVAELDKLRAENESLKQPMEKISFLLGAVIERFIPSAAPANLQAPINGTEDVDLDTLNKAVAGLLQKFTAEGIILLNSKLNSDPGAVAFVKNYVGLK